MAWDPYSENIKAMTFKAGGIFDLSGNPWTQFCDDVSSFMLLPHFRLSLVANPEFSRI